jgi:murein DD-endopeptidase MepM/ murein hydrolase activator NlpD
MWPIPGGSISSPFGRRSGRHHDGVDIRAPGGTVILSAHSGKVVFVGWRGGYGNVVELANRRVLTRYAHNMLNLVRQGDQIPAGKVIALVGKSGNASGNHLHFEVRLNHKIAVNPLNFF